MDDVDFETMSDEDFSRLVEAPPLPAQAAPVEEPELEDTGSVEEQPAVEEVTQVVEEENNDEEEDDLGQASDEEIEAHSGKPAEKPKQEAAPEATGTETAGADTPVAKPAEVPAEAVNYEQAYKQIMAPFKANKRDFTPESPEEAIRLMQMGANYTQKMQALAPNLKLMRMLENHGLLDEGKISHMIDLNRKDPGAIQKLLYDGKIDPLDLSTSEEPAYVPGNHSVSDQEMKFHETLNDVLSQTNGRETIKLVNEQWDRASKEAVYKEPAILAIINEQRENGIFDRITAEIDRRKMLGDLEGVPFIQAYKQVGDTLHQQGKLVPAQAPAPQQQVNPRPVQQANVVGTRVATPKPQAMNGDAARAASPSSAAKRTAPSDFDPFGMSDEEIMAIGNPRG